MSSAFNVLINGANAALIIFTASAAAAGGLTPSRAMRAGIGIAVVVAALCIPISSRSVFGWTVSGVERPSLPGLVLLVTLAISATMGWRVLRSAEFRFGTVALALAGFALYPAATGFLDYDTYPLGYSGYLLPAAVAALIAYALFRGFRIIAITLNLAVVAFLLNVGESRNLWDYLIDPVAWIIGCGTWLAIAVRLLIARFLQTKSPALAQPSSGIGETPISH